jgi:ornithine cyclodeaminase/alanine dehydrogenase-like protein (mu-crystallin family)
MEKLPPIRYLSASDVRRALPMAEAIAAMRQAFIQLSEGSALVPPRSCLNVAGHDSVFLLMPCQSRTQERLAVKCLTFSPSNPSRALPLIQSLVLLIDAPTGSPLAILDGAALTALRTGAASGVATDVLARSDAATAAIFGAGVQARTQLEAVCAVRPVRRARVFDVQEALASRFAHEMAGQLGIEVEPAATPQAALRDADIVCTVSTSREPIFRDADLRPGTHINAMGVFHPERAEVPPETVCRSRIVVDHTQAAHEEAGDLLRPLAAGLIGPECLTTELGQVLLGQKPGRQNAEEITLFKSVGVAIQDLCAAACALENAERLGVGQGLAR